MDWDGDGIGDLLTGDADGYLDLFARATSGELTEMPRVEYRGEPLQVSNNAAPAVVDWNGDGLPDLVVGSFSGYPAGLHLYLNSGVPGAPLYEDSTAVLCSGAPVTLWKAYPQTVDLNGDGLFDIVAGSADGYVCCLVNEGSQGAPVFEDFEELVSEGVPIWHASATRPFLADYDSDGAPDIILSDQSGMVYVYPGMPTGTGDEGETCSPFTVRAVRNPVVDSVLLRVEGAVPGLLTVQVFAIDGRLAGCEEVSVSGPMTEVETGLTAGSGVFLVRCVQDGRECTTRFVVRR